MIHFSCVCGMKFQVKDDFAGRSSKCPTCKQPLTVPLLDTTVAQVPEDQIDGTASSLDKAGVDGGLTVGQEIASPGQKSVSELLAGQAKTGQRYFIDKEIARGGMGAILRAVDCDIRREVAVKYMLADTDVKKKQRFVEEAQITGQLEHPNIVPIHELGVDAQKRLFFSMKMVNGRSLQQILDEMRENSKKTDYSLGRLLNILVNVCNGLAYAHSRGVVHRDLKPANIMVGDFGEVYVMDWGLAKVLKEDGKAVVVQGQFPAASVANPASGCPARFSKVVTSREPETDLTQDGAIVGTPVYMPPEQATGQTDSIDQRSDIYSLGAILYEMLTLLPPVDKEGGYLAILLRASQGEIDPPEKRDLRRARMGNIPRELSAIAMKALAKNPQDRYQNVETMREDIERFQEGRSVSAKEDTFREAAWKLVKRNRQASFTTCIALFVMAAILWFSFGAILEARAKAVEALATLKSEQDMRRERGKTSAPLFVQDAKVSADRKKLEYALAQVAVALEYDPEMSEARLLKGQLLIVTKDFASARNELEQYVQQNPKDNDATQLLALCRNARPQDSTTSSAIADVLVRQKAFGLAAQIEQDRDKLFRVYRKQIEAAWPGLGNRLEMRADGKCTLNLEACKEVADLTPLQGIPLSDLNLGNCDKVHDLTPLQGMPLIWINLGGCGQVRDLTPLQRLPLKVLNLNVCRQVRDLTPLQGMKLNTLNLGYCGQIQNLAPLLGMPLTSLNLAGCVQVQDLTPLHGLPLTSLNLEYCDKVQDLTPLQGMKLTSLVITGCRQVRDLTSLQGMPLTWLSIGDCGQIRDLTPLRDMKITSLNLSDCRQVRDFTPLQGMPLTSLNLLNCVEVRDLTLLQGMPLSSLNLSGCQVGELTPLRGMPLTSLNLMYCGQVRDLTPLHGMPLTSLYLHNCPITDLMPLKGTPLTLLALLGCGQVRDLKPLKDMKLTEIFLTPKYIAKDSMDVLRQMKSLKTISIGSNDNDRFPREEFWKKYDAGEFNK